MPPDKSYNLGLWAALPYPQAAYGQRGVLQSQAATQHSVHLTGGILRHFQAFSTPWLNPAPKPNSSPARGQVEALVPQYNALVEGELELPRQPGMGWSFKVDEDRP
jgi:hypothetical protein